MIRLQAQGLLDERRQSDDAYIPFTKALELSNGILTRKRLDKAINKGEPVRVRAIKPNPQRKNVHVQDVIELINALTADSSVKEEAARMFSEWKQIEGSKRPPLDLD